MLSVAVTVAEKKSHVIVVSNVARRFWRFWWKLHITESVTLAIAVGMSVDFTVHFGVSYLHSRRSLPRAERVKVALTEMGVSVTVAAGTTLVAGVFMTFAKVLFYVQFGTFLALIMLWSWALAVWYFMAMVAARGPEGDAWQLDVWWNKVCGERGSYNAPAATPLKH